jgi:DNA-binding transcriptional MerR regulator
LIPPDLEFFSDLGRARRQPLDLKKTYSAREVASLTGLTARQLQWWATQGVLSPSVAARPTEAGGYTERRYSPTEVLELSALAHLRKQGFTVQKIRQLLATLQDRFGVRLYDALGDGGSLTVLTDGRELFARTKNGACFNLLRDPAQPLLEIGACQDLRELTARVRPKKRKPRPPRVEG